VHGVLKGYDSVGNVILDDSVEIIHDEDENDKEIKKKERNLGVLFARGPTISILFPKEKFHEISNPFGMNQDDEEED